MKYIFILLPLFLSGCESLNFYTNKLSQKEIKIGDGMKALRLCISGKVSGADLFSQINFIKNEILIQRINNSLKTINDKNWNS